MHHTLIGGQLALPNGTKLPLSKAARAGDFVFLSGQLGLGADGKLAGDDIKTQTRQTIENIKSLLTEAGSDLSDVIKATVWLTDTGNFAAFNEIYAEYFSTNPPPRSAVCSALMLPGALVEIEVIAYCPES